MFEGNLSRIESSVEAVCRRMCRHDHHRTLSVTSVESLIKVGLLCLGRDTGRRTGTLHIHNDKRKFSHDSESECL